MTVTLCEEETLSKDVVVGKYQTHSASKADCTDNTADSNVEETEEKGSNGVVGSDDRITAPVTGCIGWGRGVGGYGDSKGSQSDGGEEFELHV
jgi:hypothetical protein